VFELKILRLRVAALPLTQANDVKAPQTPENNCTLTPALLRAEPMLLKEMVG
jgi:hypothetical protein